MARLISPIFSPTITPDEVKTILKENSCSTFEKEFIFEIFLVSEDECSNKISNRLIPTLTYVKYTKHCFYKNEKKSEILYVTVFSNMRFKMSLEPHLSLQARREPPVRS